MTLYQLPEACLVALRRMVRAAQELEIQYRNLQSYNIWHYGYGMEHKCGARRQTADAREGEVLPQQIVSPLRESRKDILADTLQLEQADY